MSETEVEIETEIGDEICWREVQTMDHDAEVTKGKTMIGYDDRLRQSILMWICCVMNLQLVLFVIGQRGVEDELELELNYC